MINKEERLILLRAQATTWTLERILKRDFDVKWFKPTLEDQLRLLRLDQWRERYHVSIGWMMQKLIPIWREKYSRFQRHKQGLGVAIATLTGKQSEEIIREKVNEEFPDDEATRRWMAARQQAQWMMWWDGPRRIQTSDNPMRDAVSYARRIRQERLARANAENDLTRRNYRGNPWLRQG